MKLEIKGVDADKGLALYDNDMEIYITVLRSFVRHTPKFTDRLRDVTKENLQGYYIGVHGLKSICAGIGAEELTRNIYMIEKKAKSGDLDGVLAGNEVILEDTENLVSDISTWLEKLDSQGESKWQKHRKK